MYEVINEPENIISIHTTRVGGDDEGMSIRVNLDVISIHTTRVGGDFANIFRFGRKFLISIHTTRVGGDLTIYIIFSVCNISIHTTRVGGDSANNIGETNKIYFNPHHPCGW